MGGAVGAAQSFVGRKIESIPVVGKTANTLMNITPQGQLMAGLSAADRTVEGAKTLARAPKDAADQASAASREQARLAAAAEAKMALQPKKTASDDFLANKNKMLQNMRLGLMSSVGGTAGAAAPSLSAPSLTGKSKLGA